MKLGTKEQVLLAVYMEYQKDLPKMEQINNTDLNMDIDVFHTALEKLENEGMICGVRRMAADNNRFYCLVLDRMMITREGIGFVEEKFGIQKEATARDKLTYLIKKCGVEGWQALKLIGVAALSRIGDII